MLTMTAPANHALTLSAPAVQVGANRGLCRKYYDRTPLKRNESRRTGRAFGMTMPDNEDGACWLSVEYLDGGEPNGSPDKKLAPRQKSICSPPWSFDHAAGKNRCYRHQPRHGWNVKVWPIIAGQRVQGQPHRFCLSSRNPIALISTCWITCMMVTTVVTSPLVNMPVTPLAILPTTYLLHQSDCAPESRARWLR